MDCALYLVSNASKGRRAVCLSMSVTVPILEGPGACSISIVLPIRINSDESTSLHSGLQESSNKQQPLLPGGGLSWTFFLPTCITSIYRLIPFLKHGLDMDSYSLTLLFFAVFLTPSSNQYPINPPNQIITTCIHLYSINVHAIHSFLLSFAFVFAGIFLVIL